MVETLNKACHETSHFALSQGFPNTSTEQHRSIHAAQDTPGANSNCGNPKASGQFCVLQREMSQ